MRPNELIKDWIREDGIKRIAEQLGCTKSAVSQWASGRRGISPELAILIEKRTRGRITRRQLLPELFEPLDYD